MTKRTPPSQADDKTAAAPTPPPRTRARAGSVRDIGAPTEQPAPAESASGPMGSEPSEEDIRFRAYELYLERGGAPGEDFADWLRAEQELKRKR